MKRLFSFILVCFLVVNVFATESIDISSASLKTAQYLHGTVQDPTVAPVGGEWTVIGLSESDADITDEYFERYYKNVEEYVKDKKGILHSRKYTEYSRTVLALTAIGKDPRSVAGYDLLLPLGDYKKTVQQGVNGAAWALIALDCGKYELPKNPFAEIQATREMYIEYILHRQNPDGGWSLGDAGSDVDITAMCLQALAKYKNFSEVRIVCSKGVDFLSKAQTSNGNFVSRNAENAESLIQVIVALCALDISLEDARFVKNGNTLMSSLRYFMTDTGSFKHLRDDTDANLMTTEQGLICLVKIKRHKGSTLEKLFAPIMLGSVDACKTLVAATRIAEVFFDLVNSQ